MVSQVDLSDGSRVVTQQSAPAKREAGICNQSDDSHLSVAWGFLKGLQNSGGTEITNNDTVLLTVHKRSVRNRNPACDADKSGKAFHITVNPLIEWPVFTLLHYTHQARLLLFCVWALLCNLLQ